MTFVFFSSSLTLFVYSFIRVKKFEPIPLLEVYPLCQSGVLPQGKMTLKGLPKDDLRLLTMVGLSLTYKKYDKIEFILV